jgi:hypothetical protein
VQPLQACAAPCRSRPGNKCCQTSPHLAARTNTGSPVCGMRARPRPASQRSSAGTFATSSRASCPSRSAERASRSQERRRRCLGTGRATTGESQGHVRLQAHDPVPVVARSWSYCGLGIVTRASGEWKRNPSEGRWQHVQSNVQTRGLNRNCCSQLKAVFRGAAVTVIAKCHSPPSWSHRSSR